jgi:hypothetical protein
MGKGYTCGFKNYGNKYFDKNACKRELNGRKWLRGPKPPNREVLAPDEKKKKEKEKKKKRKMCVKFSQYIKSSLLAVLVTATG